MAEDIKYESLPRKIANSASTHATTIRATEAGMPSIDPKPASVHRWAIEVASYELSSPFSGFALTSSVREPL